MTAVVDQMGRKVEVPNSPQRIISLVPSQTELLYDLGLGDRVVGITKFCIHPKDWRSDKTIVGGTKHYHFDRVEGLQPDLIIGNKEENDKAAIEQLAAQYPVWMSDIATLDDALSMIRQVGDLVNKSSEAEDIAASIQGSFAAIKKHNHPRSALYLIWKDPYMAAGKGTFINEMMDCTDFENCIQESRYPNLTLDEIKVLNPESVLLSSEPYPFKEQHLEELKELLPNAEIRLVDGELFSWYGSRLIKSTDYFEALRK